MAAVTICSDIGAPENKVSHCFQCFWIYLPWRNGTGCYDHFFKYKFIYFNWRPITILYWFCHTSTWIRHRYTRVPHPEPPLHLPPHTIPLGHPSAPAPSILYPASNLDWRFVSHMILYMFQCHSPKSSHPCPLPQSTKDCSIHLCLFFCLGIQGYHYCLSKFHIYALVHCIGVFLSGLLHSV